MWWEPASRLQLISEDILIPEPLVHLLVHWEASHVFLLFYGVDTGSPTGGSELLFVSFVEKVDGAWHVSAMSYMALHPNLMHSCHFINIDILCEQFQVVDSLIFALSRSRHWEMLGRTFWALSLLKEIHISGWIKSHVVRKDPFAWSFIFSNWLEPIWNKRMLFSESFCAIQVILGQCALIRIKEQILLVLPRLRHELRVSQEHFIVETIPILIIGRNTLTFGRPHVSYHFVILQSVHHCFIYLQINYI